VTDEVPPGDAGAAPGPAGGPPRRQPIAAGRAFALVVVAIVLGVVLLDVGTRAPAGTASGATTTTLPASSTTTTVRHGGASSTTTTVSHANVHVQVANGVGSGEYATDFSQLLSAAGWNTLPPEDTNAVVADSAVYYAAGQEAAANSIADTLKLPRSAVAPITTSLPVSSTSGIDVLVIIGPGQLPAQFSSTTTT